MKKYNNIFPGRQTQLESSFFGLNYGLFRTKNYYTAYYFLSIVKTKFKF